MFLCKISLPQLCVAFLEKTRIAYREGRSLTDEKQYEGNIRLAQEVALVLRKNVVQAKKTMEMDVWSVFRSYQNPIVILFFLTPCPELNIHRHSEIGDNNTIKNPSKNQGGGEQATQKGVIIRHFS